MRKRCLRRFAIISFATGESSEDDAGDGCGARSGRCRASNTDLARVGVTGPAPSPPPSTALLERASAGLGLGETSLFSLSSYAWTRGERFLCAPHWWREGAGLGGTGGGRSSTSASGSWVSDAREALRLCFRGGTAVKASTLFDDSAARGPYGLLGRRLGADVPSG